MKFLLMFAMFVINTKSYSKDLSCSANGTDVYYINGVLTKRDKNKSDAAAIGALFDLKINQLDSGPPLRKDGKTAVQFIGIHNPSFGLVNDAAELFAQAYYAKTGSDQNAKAIFNLVKNVPDELVNTAKAYDPTGFTSAIQMLGFSNSLNFSTLKYIAEENTQMAQVRSLASTESLINGKDGSIQVVESIYTHAKASKDAGRKILFVAHSQGNAVLNAGIKKIEQNDSPQVDYMKKFMGAFHVASPVPPLSLSYKSRNIRSDRDGVIRAAEIFSRTFIPQEFQITPASITHNVTSSTSTDPTGHFFHDTYLSQNVLVRPVGTSATPVKMSDVFTNTLSDLATDLEDNCYDFDLTSNLIGNITDGFKDNGIFPSAGYVEFSLNLSSAFSSMSEVQLYRTDTNELLSPKFSFTFSSGGDYILPLKLVPVIGGDPIFKTVKIHLSPRVQVAPQFAQCDIWYNDEKGYFSFNGAIRSWGFSKVGNGPLFITIDGRSQYHGSVSYGYGPIVYPDLAWFATDLADDTRRSHHLVIIDSAGVIFDQVINNPCEEGMSLPQNGIISIL